MPSRSVTTLLCVALLGCSLVSAGVDVGNKNILFKDEAAVKKQAAVEKQLREATRALEGTAPLRGGDDWLKIIPKPHGMMKVGQTLQWEAGCFKKNTAVVKELTDTHVTYEIDSQEPTAWHCYDLYVFCSSSNWHLDYYVLRGKHTLKFKLISDIEHEFVTHRGYGVFEVRDGLIGTVHDAWKLYNFFEGVGSEGKNMEFLTRQMGTHFTERSTNLVNITPDVDVKEGDLVIINKMVGRWGAFETLEKWVTGAYAGHSGLAMKLDGVFSICESGVEDKDGNEIIGCSPYDEWVKFNFNDESKPNIVILPLSDEARKNFNRDAAEEMIKKFLGSPYGYHNLIFSWIDTPEDNFPPPLEPKLFAAAMSVANTIVPDVADKIWGEALNERLGTSKLDTEEIMIEASRRGIPFADLLAIPELDDTDYSDGKSFTCVTFAVAVWKAAGIFGNKNIQATEFTVRDAYQLKIFDSNYKLPEACKVDGMPYCQIMGKYKLDLPGYNTVEMYDKMNERCPSLPPKYDRPSQC